MLKSLLTLMLEVTVKVETPLVLTTTQKTSVSQTHHASNTLLKILREISMLRLDARTAPGHHAQLGKTAKTNVGLSSIRHTLSRTTTVLSVLPR